MVEIVKLSDQLSQALQPYLEDVSEHKVGTEIPKSQYQSSGTTSFNICKAFWNDLGILWMEESIQPNFEEERDFGRIDKPFKSYEINWMDISPDIKDKCSYWSMQMKYKKYKRIYSGVKNDKQTFCLMSDCALIFDESALIVYDLAKQSIEIFKLPKELKSYVAHLKVKTLLVICKVKFILFKYKHAGVKKISLLTFKLNQGKARFYTPLIDLHFDKRLRWKKFYNPKNLAIIIDSYLFFHSDYILFVFDKQNGTLLQTIPIALDQSSNNPDLNALNFQLFYKKYLFIEKGSGQKYFFQEKNKDFSNFNSILDLKNATKVNMAQIEKLMFFDTMPCEEKKALYREINSRWLLDLALIPANNINKLDKFSQRIILYLIKSSLNDCEIPDFVRFSFYFLLKYDDIQILRIIKLLQFICTETPTYSKSSPQLFKLIINKLPFVGFSSHNSLSNENDVGEANLGLLQEFEIKKEDWCYKTFLDKLFSIISKEGDENGLLSRIVSSK